jgi:hypothetical protein
MGESRRMLTSLRKLVSLDLHLLLLDSILTLMIARVYRLVVRV